MRKQIITDLTILRQKSSFAEPSEVAEILNDLNDSLDTKKGIGLSAIQIGIPKRISIIRIGEKKIDLINAEIIEKAEPFRMQGEGCLSLPSIYVDTRRYNYIKVKNGNGEIFVCEGLEAVCIQHENDHTFGVILLDKKWRAR
jgi:peptide deformylase